MRFLVVLLVSCILGLNVQAQTSFRKVSHFLVSNEKDSAFLEIQNINDRHELAILIPILTETASYKDFHKFVLKNAFSNRRDYQNLFNFVDKCVKTPLDRQKVNLDYVVLQSSLIDLLANELELSDAVDQQKELSDYMNSIQDKSGDYELADLYVRRFDALLGVIQDDAEILNEAEARMYRALSKGDTVLFCAYSVLVSNKFIYSKDLEGYNKFMLGVYDLVLNSEINEIYLLNVTHKLLNGLMYSGYEDQEFIETLLFKLFNSVSFHNQSYSMYYFYFNYYLKNDLNKINLIVNKLGYADLKSMIIYCVETVLPELKNDDYVNCLLDAARVSFYVGEQEFAMELMFQAITGTRKTYSRELSEILSDYKTSGLQRETDLTVAQQKEKNKIYLKFGVFIFVLFILTAILALALARRSKVLQQKNSENEALIIEKDLLMLEIHHRVKNNFQLVSALLELQSYDTESEEAKKKLYEGQARIQSLSLIHNKLYESNQSTWVDMQQYIEELSLLMLKSADLSDSVKMAITAKDVVLDIDTITPLGLIINELITNSCKYAFVGDGSWGLHISLEKTKNDKVKLVYKEVGVKSPVSELPKDNKGLGLNIIRNLVKQLQGELEMDYSNGMNVEILFKDKVGRKKMD